SGDGTRGSSSAGMGETSSGMSSGPRPTQRRILSTRLKNIELDPGDGDAVAADELHRAARRRAAGAQGRPVEERAGGGEARGRGHAEVGAEVDGLLGGSDDQGGAAVEPARDVDAQAAAGGVELELAIGAEPDPALALERDLAAGGERQAGDPGAVL